MTELEQLQRQTQHIYETNANEFDQQRNKSLFEKQWLDKFISFIPRGGSILDLGCGSGEPVSSYLVNQGYSITGIDFATNMLSLARKRLPEQRWVLQDMRHLQLERRFHGILSWNGFFHLNQDEQVGVLEKCSQYLHASGALLLTVGPDKGETCGQVNGHEVYHASLSPQAYKKTMEKYHLQLIDFVPNDSTCQDHSVLLAQKNNSASNPNLY